MITAGIYFYRVILQAIFMEVANTNHLARNLTPHILTINLKVAISRWWSFSHKLLSKSLHLTTTLTVS